MAYVVNALMEINVLNKGKKLPMHDNEKNDYYLTNTYLNVTHVCIAMKNNKYVTLKGYDI